MKQVKVLMVCLGNICRSPTAEGVFTHVVNKAGLSDKIHIDSAGTHAYHVGEPPDERAQLHAKKRGIDLSQQRARRVNAEDFAVYDFILAMDHENLRNLQAMCPPDARHKVQLFLDFAPGRQESQVPDPYYGGAQGFEFVLDLVEEASQGLLSHIQNKLM